MNPLAGLTGDVLTNAIEACPQDGANEILRLRKYERAWEQMQETLAIHANHEGPTKYLVAYEKAKDLFQ